MVWVFFFRFGASYTIVTLVFLIITNINLWQTFQSIEKGTGIGVKGPSFGWLYLVIILTLAFAYIWAKLTYYSWRYQLTEDVFKMEHGVIWKRYISIPYERIQNVDIYRGLLDRIFGLSDLHIQTAGYSGYARTEGRLPGLLPEDAERLREDLIKRVKGTKQGL